MLCGGRAGSGHFEAASHGTGRLRSHSVAEIVPGIAIWGVPEVESSVPPPTDFHGSALCSSDVRSHTHVVRFAVVC